MKSRLYTLLKFFALNILFFAIYFNFIYKDVNTQLQVPASTNMNVASLVAIQAKKAMPANHSQAEKR